MRLALLRGWRDAGARRALRLTVERFGPPGDQRGLFEDPAAARAAACGRHPQARAAAGPEAALRVLEVDPDSRLPERRAVWRPTNERPAAVVGAPPGRRQR